MEHATRDNKPKILKNARYHSRVESSTTSSRASRHRRHSRGLPSARTRPDATLEQVQSPQSLSSSSPRRPQTFCPCSIQMCERSVHIMKPKKKLPKVKSKRSKMPKFFPIDDQMKELSAMLEKEISDWHRGFKEAHVRIPGSLSRRPDLCRSSRSRARKSPTPIMIKSLPPLGPFWSPSRKDSMSATVSAWSGGGCFSLSWTMPRPQRAPLGWLGRAYEARQKSSRRLTARSDFSLLF